VLWQHRTGPNPGAVTVSGSNVGCYVLPPHIRRLETGARRADLVAPTGVRREEPGAATGGP